MIGLSPLVMDTGVVAFRGSPAPPQPRELQLKSRLITATAWILALLELVVAVTLALGQGLLIAMILMASLESSEQGDQPEPPKA
ncbi:MAG: hypothetical protein F4Z75_09165 [Synechococcus sp. SB0668_bin_15]|nr:hypothetical protein [Synechococcus sp. SB0668_bin_15]MYG47057.1 hypothetical protein [Synechococcus sp. SB0675_bin_6]MYJ60218.1 hypothetical protein [Synechococcus sp. SB0672_bin_6]MYK91074.1 hypothetical protein [Synechococcus sp. SB0669_bin_8]